MKNEPLGSGIKFICLFVDLFFVFRNYYILVILMFVLLMPIGTFTHFNRNLPRSFRVLREQSLLFNSCTKNSFLIIKKESFFNPAVIKQVKN